MKATLATGPRRSLRRAVFGAVILGVLAAAWPAWNRWRHSNSENDPGLSTVARTAVSTDGPALAPSSYSQSGGIFAEGRVPGLHPEQDGWDTESFSDAAGKQLKIMEKLLAGSSLIDADAVSALVADSCSVQSLRPERLAQAFRDSNFLVRRGEASSAAVRGAAGLAQALEGLRVPFQAGIERSKVKIYRVDLKGSVAETAAYFATVGKGPEGRIEQNCVLYCEWEPRGDKPPRLLSLRADEFEEVVQQGDGGGLFADATTAVLRKNTCFREQLAHSIDHWRTRIEGNFGVYWTGFEGAAVGDANGDGLPDLYVCQPGGMPNRLFIQQPDGSAVDEAAQRGVDWMDLTRAAMFVDLDNDGDQDLVVGFSRGLVIQENDGKGNFRPVTLLRSGWEPFSLSAADYDNDGRLDIYVCNYSSGWSSRQIGRGGNPTPYWDARNGDPNIMYHNDGTFRFSDVTEATGLNVNNDRFSLSAAWEDYDNDGDLDLYVANDFGRNNLYRNDNGHFVDVADAAGVEDISPGMSASWGDFDLDGLPDLYIGNMFSAAGNRITFQQRFKPQTDPAVRQMFQRHARGNSLYRNRGDGTFEDVSVAARVTLGRWAWSSLFTDINNDGYEDLVVVNGYVTQESQDDL